MSVTFHWDEGLTLEGSATVEDADALFAAVMADAPHHTGPLTVHLYDLELETGVATVACHQLVRLLRDQFGTVILREAPQMLAHSLYKVGDLSDGRVVLDSPRSDEGVTVN